MPNKAFFEITNACNLKCSFCHGTKRAIRYLSAEELALAESQSLYAELWCAKEALYKYHKKGGLDLVDSIKILDYDSEKSLFVATILDGEPIEVALSRQADVVVAQIG